MIEIFASWPLLPVVPSLAAAAAAGLGAVHVFSIIRGVRRDDVARTAVATSGATLDIFALIAAVVSLHGSLASDSRTAVIWAAVAWIMFAVSLVGLAGRSPVGRPKRVGGRHGATGRA